ncbi:PhzF family phenazine biosynthesis protein [Microvirga antarctica]|uniref:PhzF family phenazine biosynthesis protein n=1 Tax=Microvirga antarctica TaxID=2819233 RepID=UPI001B3183A0|nr:PhzF family phenazine biosynthesis protein [Microvirga antarctica]
MRRVAFETVDVFTERRFGGNPLAVFTDAHGLETAEMQALAAEMNLSETTFVLPPEDPAHTARVRIFNRTTEMPFAGHPSIGTAFVIARASKVVRDALILEVPAGLVAVAIERNADGEVLGGKITAPQPLSLGEEVPAETIAACIGIDPQDIVVDAHRPILASVGNPYVIAQITEAAVSRCVPDMKAFRRAADERPHLNGRFSLHVYARDGNHLHARMFAPLAGTFEDPATGSANAPLGAMLLRLTTNAEARYTVRQGEEMGRPSLLHLTASRREDAIIATVAGRCVPVLQGYAQL